VNRAIKLLLVVVPFCAVGALSAPDADAQQWRPPPPAYVASYRPVYYNGYAHYWYGNHWFYRDHGGAWHGYAHEPEYLGRFRAGWSRNHYHWR
jgi:hypothetical protein